jgi:hypothetical protein
MAKEIRSVTLGPPDQSRKFLTIHLDVLDNDKLESIDARIQVALAMGLMSILQEMQAKHRIPIPSNLRPHGPPNLTVVATD